MNPPCVIFEDDHLLVINKPAGWNTHSSSPFAGEGAYEWLRHREPRWARLAIIHRLDKETSGVLAFSKSEEGNRSLTDQFTRHSVRKTYVLETDRQVRRSEFTVATTLVKVGERYASRPPHAGAARAETRFRVIDASTGRTVIEAQPVTGKTHQIRVHAAENGFPILGDTLYGGTAAARLHLHAQELTLNHPTTGSATTFRAPVDFADDTRIALRRALIQPVETTVFRLIHGASDDWPKWQVDRLGEYLLSQSEARLTASQQLVARRWLTLFALRGVYHKTLVRQIARTTVAQASPQNLFGDVAPPDLSVMENGARFALSFTEGYSVGLFLDQRDNRRRFLANHVAANFPLFNNPSGAEILNTFAYTCGFSLCAAIAGARTTSLDLSKKYLEWGKRNFGLNGLDAAAHDFIHGDAFDWLKRLGKQRRRFDCIVLDPPTFSRSKEHGQFRVEKDFNKLVVASLPLLKAGGVLFASTNAAKLLPDTFLAQISAAVGGAQRRILQQHYVPQPPDFPISRGEPAYLKTVWTRIN